ARDLVLVTRCSADISYSRLCLFLFNDPATTEIYTLSLHDALPISMTSPPTLDLDAEADVDLGRYARALAARWWLLPAGLIAGERSEEHTSELQSRGHLVCRLLLEKKKNIR